jgi:general secretion pathway protein F
MIVGAFEYTAVDSAGKERKGVLEGDTPRQVRQLLRERALLPLQVTEVAQKEARRVKDAGGPLKFGLRPSLSALDLAMITRQLATLVRSGLPLEEALLAIGEQSDKPRNKSIVLGVRSRVMEGHALAEGLRDFPQAFPEIFRATVAAGEQSGHLDAVLERLADYTESRQILRQKVQHALVYPIILTTMAVGIVTMLLVYVVPQVVSVFSSLGQELPLLTRTLIAISDFLRANGIWVVLALVALIFVVRSLLKKPGPAFALSPHPAQPAHHRAPCARREHRTLHPHAQHPGRERVPVLESLRIAGEVVSNIPMRDSVQSAAVRVREGAPIGKSLAAGGLFPPMTIHLINSGEASGELETMLERAAANQEREMDTLIATLLAVMEPMLILVMGAIVLVIVIAILLPIFQINTLIK